LEILRVIVQERAAMYDSLLFHCLNGRQRAMLSAVAQGNPLQADQKMSEVTGIPVNSLTSVMRSLRGGGWIAKIGQGESFDDPFLRVHLILAAGDKLT
jgi:hypothetical protein